MLSRRTVSTDKITRNDIFSICNLLANVHHSAVTPRNIISGFSGTGIWNSDIRDIDPSKIKPESFTSAEVRQECLDGIPGTRSVTAVVESSDNPSHREITMERLCELFKKKSSDLISDGVITENGTVKVCTRMLWDNDQ